MGYCKYDSSIMKSLASIIWYQNKVGYISLSLPFSSANVDLIMYLSLGFFLRPISSLNKSFFGDVLLWQRVWIRGASSLINKSCISCVLPWQWEKRGGDDEVGSGTVCTTIGFFVGSWSGVVAKSYFFILYIIFLRNKPDKSAKNEDEIPLNSLNKVGHNWLMTKIGSFLPTLDKVISIKTKYTVCGS